LVAAALASTFEPTIALLRDAARRASAPLEVSELLCEGAWPLFERGDLSGYERAIADALQRSPDQVDVVVLAQASMAGAAALLPGWRTPLLSSPRLGLEAALRRYRAGATSSS